MSTKPVTPITYGQGDPQGALLGTTYGQANMAGAPGANTAASVWNTLAQPLLGQASGQFGGMNAQGGRQPRHGLPIAQALGDPGDYYYTGDDPNFQGMTKNQAAEMNTPEYRQQQMDLDYISTLPWNERGQHYNAMQNRTGITDIMSGEQALKGRALDNQAQQIANQLSMMQPFLGSLGDMFGGMGGWWEGGGPSGMFGEGGLGGWLRGVYGNEVAG